MDDVLNHLNRYCSGILDEKSLKKKGSSSNETGKNEPLTDGSANSLSKYKGANPVINRRTSLKSNSHIKQKKEKSKSKEIHNDILSNSLLNDSDLATVFENEDKPESLKNLKLTEDGFKIMPLSSIPRDDSDISDAFESDVDDQVLRKQDSNEDVIKLNESDHTNQLDLKNKYYLPGGKTYSNIKKPLLKLIDEFGMKERIFLKLSENHLSDKKSTQKSLVVMDYSKRRGKRKKNGGNSLRQNTEGIKPVSDQKEAFKKARYEVFKYSITGFEPTTKENLKVNLAVKLGAIRPKRKAQNYKIILEEKAKEKKTKESMEGSDSGALKVMKPNERKSVKKKRENPSLHFKLGKFRNGVLTLSKKDAERLL